jgi:hypothetical protein
VDLCVFDLWAVLGQTTILTKTVEYAGPVGDKCEWDLLSVTYCPGSTAVADATAVTVQVDKVNSGAGTTTAILAATSLVAGDIAADVPTSLFRGRVNFVEGDHLKFTFVATGTLDTPAVGASITIETEVTERSGA